MLPVARANLKHISQSGPNSGLILSQFQHRSTQTHISCSPSARQRQECMKPMKVVPPEYRRGDAALAIARRNNLHRTHAFLRHDLIGGSRLSYFYFGVLHVHAHDVAIFNLHHSETQFTLGNVGTFVHQTNRWLHDPGGKAMSDHFFPLH